MPEVKIRKVVRAVEHAAHFVLSYSVQICEILTFRQTVSLPIIAANIQLFWFLKKLVRKIGTAFPANPYFWPKFFR